LSWDRNPRATAPLGRNSLGQDYTVEEPSWGRRSLGPEASWAGVLLRRISLVQNPYRCNSPSGQKPLKARSLLVKNWAGISWGKIPFGQELGRYLSKQDLFRQ